MIIIRRKDAKPIATAIHRETDKFYMTKFVMYSATRTLIYFDGGIHYETLSEVKLYQKIGMLERENIPFVLLLNKKCEIGYTGDYITVTNPNCIKMDFLLKFLDNKKPFIGETNKAKIFDAIFRECFDYEDNLDKNFVDLCDHFTRSAAENGLITKDVVFIVVDANDGTIFNANSSMGSSIDSGKIWYFDEEYDYNPSTVDMPDNQIETSKEENYLEEFAKAYKSSHINAIKLSDYTEDQITEILIKFPPLFRDLVRRGYSYYNVEDYEWIENFMDAPSIKKEEDEKEDNEEKDEWEEYYDAISDTPPDLAMCFSCERYVVENDVNLCTIEGKLQNICKDCQDTSGYKHYE